MLEQTLGLFYSACMEISQPVPGWRGCKGLGHPAPQQRWKGPWVGAGAAMPSRGSGPSLAKSCAAGPGAAVPLPGCLCAAPQCQAGCSPVPSAAPCWGAAPVPGGHPGLAGPLSPRGSASRCGLGDGSERRSLSLCPELPSAWVPQREEQLRGHSLSLPCIVPGLWLLVDGARAG